MTKLVSCIAMVVMLVLPPKTKDVVIKDLPEAVATINRFLAPATPNRVTKMSVRYRYLLTKNHEGDELVAMIFAMKIGCMDIKAPRTLLVTLSSDIKLPGHKEGEWHNVSTGRSMIFLASLNSARGSGHDFSPMLPLIEDVCEMVIPRKRKEVFASLWADSTEKHFKLDARYAN
ncbi:hypothetical protein KW785_00740 [Candidatus Parcubacteria bacterium]|nr:hypothetical protein [Candidatus Parcubacteria bacterium]